MIYIYTYLDAYVYRHRNLHKHMIDACMTKIIQNNKAYTGLNYVCQRPDNIILYRYWIEIELLPADSNSLKRLVLVGGEGTVDVEKYSRCVINAFTRRIELQNLNLIHVSPIVSL